MTFWNRLAQIRGIGTGANRVLWIGSLAALLGGLALDCSEFSPTPLRLMITTTLYVLAVFGWTTWLIRRLAEVPKS